MRDWVIRFDDNWRHTYFRAPTNEKSGTVIDNLARSAHLCSKVFKVMVVFNGLLSLGVVVYGGITNYHLFGSSAILYVGWGIITVVWCLVATIVNLTALFHYFILTRAIIIRFTEVRFDFESAIRSKPPAEPWVLSKLFEKHYIVCDMVIGSNQYFKTYLFFFFTIMVTHECFLFYQIFTVRNALSVSFLLIKISFIHIYHKIENQIKAVIGFYIVFDAIQILLVSLCSAKITSSAHKPYHVVHGVGKMTLPEDVQVQVRRSSIYQTNCF